MPRGAHARRPQRRRFALRPVLAVVLAGATVMVGTRLASWGGNFPSIAVPGPTPQTSVAPSVSAPPPIGDVERVFPRSASGRRFTLTIRFGGGVDEDCALHSIRNFRLYWADCPGWEAIGMHLNFFLVVLKNETDRAIGYRLDRFRAQPRGGGKSMTPVSLAGVTRSPELMSPDEGTLAPHQKVQGFLALDREGFVPLRVSYLMDDHAVRVRFVGKHRVIPAA